MNMMLCAATMITIMIAAVLVWNFRRIATSEQRAARSLSGLHEFSIEKYRPIQRLLSQEDCEFLRQRQGISPTLAKRFQNQRRRIVRLFLMDLARDFENIYGVATLCLVHAAEDKPGLALDLLRRKWTFRYAMALAYLRLMLQPVGLKRVDARELVDAVEAMYGRLRQSNVVLLTAAVSR